MEDDFEDDQLLSFGEVAQVYYQLLKTEMESSAAQHKAKGAFDGSLEEEVANQMSEFADRHQISSFSQTLAELLTLLEWQNEKRVPPIQDGALYNSLLRVEKSANNASSWELCGKEGDGTLISMSSFEINMLEQTVSMFLADFLCKDRSQILFFPLSRFYETDTIIKWRILAKIASINVTPQKTIYKHKLAECMRNRIQAEVNDWLTAEISKLQMSGKNTVLKDAEMLTKSLKELRSHLKIIVDILGAEGSLFREASCPYFECLATVLDQTLQPVCVAMMHSMDTYQENHKTFHVNLRDSCALSHALYIQIKHLVHFVKRKLPTNVSFKLEDYNSMFVKFFMNLLQVVKSECHNRIKRAVELENKDSIHVEDKIFSSSVIALNCFCTVIDEWKHVEIENEDLQIAYVIKITDIVCDGAKIFAEALDHRFAKENQQPANFENAKKTCVLVNSIEHVRRYLEELPRQMQWTEHLRSMRRESEDGTFCDQVLRILRLVHRSMDSHLKSIASRITNAVAEALQSQCEKPLTAWLQSTNTGPSYDRFLCHFNDYLESVHESLKEELFPTFLSHLWTSILMYIQRELQEGQPPEYAISLKDDIQNLMDYFEYIKMEELDTHKSVLQEILFTLDLNSKSTVDLQLEYYTQIAESIVSPVEYLGHIAFQAGYKLTEGDSVDLYINVQKGQRFPIRKFEMSELYVKLELCPSSLFPNQAPLKSVPATEDLDNPVFNQFFQFCNLSDKVLSVKGAVIQVVVLNQDKSFNACAMLLLNQVQSMSGVTSLEFLPVYLMPLRKIDKSQTAYQVLESRSRWDKNAKTFIHNRNKITKQTQATLLSCIKGKNTCFFLK